MGYFNQALGRRLADDPGQVRVNKIVGNTTSVYEFRVGEDERGTVIGKQGRTLQALRTILDGVAAKERRCAILEILE